MDYPQNSLCSAGSAFFVKPHHKFCFLYLSRHFANAIEAQIDSSEVSIVVALKFEIVCSRRCANIFNLLAPELFF
jgi:hypothetical protein